MARDFFALWCRVPDIDQAGFYAAISKPDKRVAHALYRPNLLDRNREFGRGKVNGIYFWNVSFAKTLISNIEFTDCTFEQCLFMGSVFDNCRFTSCKFIDSNPHRIEFNACYVDPKSFSQCIPDRRFANIGTYLFQELLRNSRQQVQPEFIDAAQLYYYRWRRWLVLNEAASAIQRTARLARWWEAFSLWFYEATSGSGTSLKRLAVSSGLAMLFLTLVNWKFVGLLGLTNGSQRIGGPIEAAYLSIATSLGFGDLSPATAIGRLVISFELIIGFIIFAVLTSTIFRRITS